MGKMYSWACLFSVLLGRQIAADECHGGRNVLLVSMDGFRWDYFETANTPNFEKLFERGVKAERMTVTFTPKTFPSHYSLATGLYQESHGIVGNGMYDPVFNETFGRKSFESKWWRGGEPIWVTSRKQGKRSATYFWPGSEAEIHGYRPNIWRTYNDSIPFEQRVEEVVTWFKKDNINMATLYFHEPDRTGHRFGPDSQEVRDMVEYMDNVLGLLMAKFDEENLWENVNLIVTSDHGFTDIDLNSKLIDISEYVNISTIKTVENGPCMQVFPIMDNFDEVFRALEFSHPNMTVYKKEDIPKRWHYANNRRVAPIFLVADLGWSITWSKALAATIRFKGNHGYDNEERSMDAIWVARGPFFREGYVSEPIKMTDVYPLVCEILGIKPAPNNGSLDVGKTMMNTHWPMTCGSVRNVSQLIVLFVAILVFKTCTFDK